jgi:hypothetical protein
MAIKISKVNAERLKKLGISAKTEEEAKKILLDRLEKAGIPGMDEETIDNLIDIVGSFAELEGEAEEEAAPADPTPAEAQADELAEEAAEEEAEAAAEEDPEPEAEPEEEPTEEEAAPAPKPKKAAPKKAAPAKKAEKAAEDKPAKESKKKPSKRNEKGTRLKPQTNPDDLEMLRKALSKFFPEKEFQYVTVSQGISIKFGGANSHPVAIMFENVYAKEGELATTNVVLNTFRSQASQDKLADDGVDFVPTWNNLPWLKGISWSDAMEIVKTYLPDIKSAVSTADTRLGKNREKMEADLKATGKKAAPAPKKEAPKAAPAEDPKAKARAALAKAAAAKKAKAAKK